MILAAGDTFLDDQHGLETDKNVPARSSFAGNSTEHTSGSWTLKAQSHSRIEDDSNSMMGRLLTDPESSFSETEFKSQIENFASVQSYVEDFAEASPQTAGDVFDLSGTKFGLLRPLQHYESSCNMLDSEVLRSRSMSQPLIHPHSSFLAQLGQLDLGSSTTPSEIFPSVSAPKLSRSWMLEDWKTASMIPIMKVNGVSAPKATSNAFGNYRASPTSRNPYHCAGEPPSRRRSIVEDSKSKRRMSYSETFMSTTTTNANNLLFILENPNQVHGGDDDYEEEEEEEGREEEGEGDEGETSDYRLNKTIGRRHSTSVLGTSSQSTFTCPWNSCGKVFNRIYNLRSHYRIHSGERPFNCELCEASFARNHDLKRHQRIHSGMKPFKCSSCQKCFSRNDAMNRHLKTSSCRNGIAIDSLVERAEEEYTFTGQDSPAAAYSCSAEKGSLSPNLMCNDLISALLINENGVLLPSINE